MWGRNTESCSWKSCRGGNTETEEEKVKNKEKESKMKKKRTKSNLVIE